MKPNMNRYEVVMTHPTFGRASVRLFATTRKGAAEMALAKVRADHPEVPGLSCIPTVIEIAPTIGAAG
jgi:hypothetical protein